MVQFVYTAKGKVMSSRKKAIIIGAGGAAREIYNYFFAEKRIDCADCIGFLQDSEYAQIKQLPGYPPIVGPIHGYTPVPEYHYLLGIGEPIHRFNIAQYFKKYWDQFPTLETEVVKRVRQTKNVEIGLGGIIGGNSLSCDIKIGHFVYLNFPFSIGHDAIIGDYCEVGPCVSIGGHAVLEEGVQIAPHCTIAPGVKIGAWSKISANSSVLKNVPPCSLVMGVPGKIYKDFYQNPHNPN